LAPTPRQRADLRLVELGLAPTVSRAQALILAGQVLCDDAPVRKAGELLPCAGALRLRGAPDHGYVSRGGLKLAAGLDAFAVDPSGWVCADLGASTGGFTDCLLQRGAAKVYAIDVGYGQLAWSLRQDPRVVVMERTNARLLTALPEPAQLVVGDLSFTALAPMFPAMRAICAPGALLVLLVKPQFELGREHVQKGGVVTDAAARAEAVAGVLAEAQAEGFEPLGGVQSPVTGAKAGNIEHLIGLRAPGRGSG
jgi:23S rRNA (cytidine1920-2'-O)/16S rRNA (cytidine1409-2'-O)-methyltransferase